MASDTRRWVRVAAGAVRGEWRVPEAWPAVADLYGLDVIPGGLTGTTQMRGTVDGYSICLWINDREGGTTTHIEVDLSNLHDLPWGLTIKQRRAPRLVRWCVVDIDDVTWSDSFSVIADDPDEARDYLTLTRRRNLQSLADLDRSRFRWTVCGQSVSYTLTGKKHTADELSGYIGRLLNLARALDPTR